MENNINNTSRTGGATARQAETGFEHGGSTLDNIKTTVAEKLYSAADTIQQRAGQTQPDSTLATYGNQASEWLNRSADYIRDMDIEKLKTDVQSEVRRNPGRSLLIAGAAGLILGALFRRR